MEKRIFCSVSLSLTLVFLTTGVSLAGDSASIAVSCSIPSVPGLNAPPFKSENLEPAVTADMQNTQLQNETKPTTAATIQQETEQQIVLADGKAASVITQTVYSR